jgi:V/A-type H+/Na+-transporting ATPase subunit G/H
MKGELLLRIKDAEADANRKVAAAEEQAKAIVADARRQAESLLADARQQADFAYQSRIDQARAQGEADGKKTVANGQKLAGDLRKRFEAGAAAAAPRITKLFESNL